MNEMKPEDVMRALEHCANYKSQEVSCVGCPLYRKCDVNTLEGLALALLREKDAEIERLTVNMNAFGLTAKNLAEDNERLTAQIEHCDACDRIGLTHSEHEVCIKQARADAITEFAERLVTYYNALKSGLVAYHIEQIAKEMREKL